MLLDIIDLFYYNQKKAVEMMQNRGSYEEIAFQSSRCKVDQRRWQREPWDR